MLAATTLLALLPAAVPCADAPAVLGAPGTIGLSWRETCITGRIISGADTSLSLHCPRAPHEVLLDGVPVEAGKWRHDAQAKRLTLRLPGGAHRVLVSLIETDPEPPRLIGPGDVEVRLAAVVNHDTNRAYYLGSPALEPGRYRASIQCRASRPSTILLLAGPARAQALVAAAPGRQEIDLGLVALPPDAKLLVSAPADGCSIAQVRLARAMDVDLIDNGGMETDDDADGRPDRYRAGGITGGAMCEIAGAGDAHSGERCLQVVCTKPDGDYAANLQFQTIWPVDRERQFRVRFWVKTDDDATATIQLTSRDWKWWTNSPRAAKAHDWTQVEHTFPLPAGENVTHVRMHMHATRAGATLYVDDIELVELAD